MSEPRPTLASLLEGNEYLSYAYAYPHKTAYRTLSPPADLRRLWAEEDRSALFLYLHVPFCEQRCGFCNLFTQVAPKAALTDRYLDAVAEQAAVVREALGPDAMVARLALGGGTPTFLSAPQLERAFGILERFGAGAVPTSIETSPATLDTDKIALLKERKITRVSMGVQSMVPAETAGVQRRQLPADVVRSLEALAGAVPVRNVDLIYGLPGQTPESLCASIDQVLAHGANELYLYPLYVRPLTILGRKGALYDARLALYRAGRAHLLTLGFRQISMRMFSGTSSAFENEESNENRGGAVYRCQDDGMIGLGPGARSYTRRLHYASPFAVGQHAIRDRIEAWLAQPPGEHAIARHGFWLDEEERRTRYLLLSLLDRGIDRASYRTVFGEDVLARFPHLHELAETGLGIIADAAITLTEQGIERGDVLGHWLQSPSVVAARADWTAV